MPPCSSAAMAATPTGTSLFEADCLTRHYLSSNVNLAALVAYHVTLRERIGDALDGLDIQSIREMLWERAIQHA